jgi:transcriptional regulator GlxA family with amidase domain
MLDIWTTAEAVRTQIDASIRPLEVIVAGPRRRVAGTGGVTVATTNTLRELDGLELVVVPAVGTLTRPDLEAALCSGDGRAVVRAVAAVDTTRSRVAGACTGVFAVAEAGVLDGREATTTWFLAPFFRSRYPRVAVDLDRMVVPDGPFLTAGAAFAHIDLALTVLAGISPQLAGHVARLLLIDDRASQVAYVSYEHLHHDDPVVLAFERHVRAHLDEPFSVATTAAAIGASRRTLERRTRQVLGVSPLDIVKRMRVERADHLRRTTDLSTDAIARRVGYASAETLRALRRSLKASPRPTRPAVG